MREVLSQYLQAAFVNLLLPIVSMSRLLSAVKYDIAKFSVSLQAFAEVITQLIESLLLRPGNAGCEQVTYRVNESFLYSKSLSLSYTRIYSVKA